MFKKFVIPGLVLLVTGTAVLGWVLTEKNKEQQKTAYYKSKYGSEPEEYLKQYNEWLQLPPGQRAHLPWGLDKYGKTKTKAQLRQEQQERLKADLNELAAGKKNAFADILYGENWQEEVSKYKKQKELRESIFAGSIVCTFTGGAIFTCCLLARIAPLLIRASSGLRKFVAGFAESRRQTKDEKLTRASVKKDEKSLEQKPHEQKSELNGFNPALSLKVGPQKSPEVAVNSGRQNTVGVELGPTPDSDKTAPSNGNKPNSEKSERKCGKEHLAGSSTNNATKLALLLSDEESVESKEPFRIKTENMNANTMQLDVPQRAQKSASSGAASTDILSDSYENSLTLEDSLKLQTENLEKQMAEFKQMAQSVQQTTLENSKPLNNTLSELTQQVSAIREYACHQQDRLTKLQDGYDWNIIRNFCLRVIRCIDNLESRIGQMPEDDVEKVHLKEVSDELLFALESSGIEQVEPEINSDYQGQEKYAEAVKEKECCDDPNRTGKIAKVIRPGYQYFVDEENVKVVRPAQVKLFG